MIQPIWAIVDIAVSEKLSQGAKTKLLLLILIGVPVCIFSVVGIMLIPLIALIPFFYGCFFTASPAFRKATQIDTQKLIFTKQISYIFHCRLQLGFHRLTRISLPPLGHLLLQLEYSLLRHSGLNQSLRYKIGSERSRRC